MLRIRKILCPVDDTLLSLHVLDSAISLAERYEAHLIMLFVRREVANETNDEEEVLVTTAGMQQLVSDRIAAVKLGAGIDCSVVLRTGNPAEAIRLAALEGGVDIVVMGTHGRNGIGDWLRGSTTERVMATLDVPLLILRERNEHDRE